MSSEPQVFHRPRSMLSTLALGVGIVLVTAVVGGTSVILYGMYIVDHKTNDVLGSIQTIVENVPEIREALPPILSDAMDDARRPEYSSKLEIEARLVRNPRHRRAYRLAASIRNGGSETVTLLSVRFVALNSDGPVFEWNEWPATPIAMDYPGPLMPGATRHLSMSAHSYHEPEGILLDDIRVDAEVMDVRVWRERASAVEKASRSF